MAVADDLQKIGLFQKVDLADLEILVSHMEKREFSKGQVLFEAGQEGDRMYVILNGRIRIFIHNQRGEEITLTHYGVDEIFGELSPIDRRPRSASAMVADDLSVLILDREHFLAILDERPQIGLAMMRSLSQRLRNTTTYLEEYRPQRVERRVMPRGEEFRRGAEGVVADILNDLNEAENPEELGGTLMKAFQQKTQADVFSKMDGTSREESPGGGIFDRIAGVVAQKEEEENHPAQEEEDQN